MKGFGAEKLIIIILVILIVLFIVMSKLSQANISPIRGGDADNSVSDTQYMIKKRDTQHVHPSSGKLFNILRNARGDVYWRMCNLISKFMPASGAKAGGIIARVLRESKNDKQVLMNLRKYGYRENADAKPILNMRNKKQAEMTAYIMRKELNGKSPTSILDIGCSDCVKVGMIADEFEIPRDKTFGVDVKGWSLDYGDDRGDVQFSYISTDDNVKLPMEDNSIDVIMMHMMLHHAENLDSLLAEVARVAAPGALISVREHDLYNKYDYALADIEHLLYDVVSDKVDYEKVVGRYYSKFFDQRELIAIMEKHGFKLAGLYGNSTILTECTPTNYYFANFIAAPKE